MGGVPGAHDTRIGAVHGREREPGVREDGREGWRDILQAVRKVSCERADRGVTRKHPDFVQPYQLHSENFDWENRYCESSLVANGQFYEEYCDKIVTPPNGCVCGPNAEVDKEALKVSCGPGIRCRDCSVVWFAHLTQSTVKGLINPNFFFFGRGAIQLSWNANYLKASQVLSDSGETLCTQPELVATVPKYAWGTALWFWMFNKPPGQETTCHIQSLQGSFGGSLNIIK